MPISEVAVKSKITQNDENITHCILVDSSTVIYWMGPLLLACLYENRESYCHLDVGMGSGFGGKVILNFHISATIGQKHLIFEI